MFAGLVTGVGVAAERSANPQEFVRGNRGANTAAADQNTNLSRAALHSLSDFQRVIRIVIRLRAVMRAEISNLMTGAAQLLNDALVKRIASMVGANSNSH